MANAHDSQRPLVKAIRKIGSQAEFARLLGKRQSTVHSWLTRGNELPAELVLDAEEKLGISRHDLRPDLYPREDGPAQPPVGNPSPAPGGSSSSKSAIEGLQA